MPPNRTRAVVVCAAVAVLSVFGSLNFYGYARNAEQARIDPYQIEQQVMRMQPVRDAVPASTRLGYTSDLPLDNVRGLATFLGTRYALAPRLVVEAESAAAGDIVLGNFSQQLDFAAEGTKRGLSLERDLGGGLVLYRKGSR